MNDTETPLQTPPASNGGPLEEGVNLAKRRRFIKLGASAVPVTLTLASRPVMAWQCNSTSAWGSAQLAGQVGSSQTRWDSTKQTGTECWYITNWVSNTVYSKVSSKTPWQVVAEKCYPARSFSTTQQIATNITDAKALLKVSDIFPSLFGISASATVSSVLAGTAQGSDAFTKAVTVARLNYIYAAVATSTIKKCIVSSNQVDQVLEMARLGPNYSPPNSPNVTWSKTDIQTYLTKNWLAA